MEISKQEQLQTILEIEKEKLAILKEWKKEVGRSVLYTQYHKVKKIEQQIKRENLKYEWFKKIKKQGV